MMSANHLDPDLAAEIYVLDGPPDYNLAGVGNDQQVGDHRQQS